MSKKLYSNLRVQTLNDSEEEPKKINNYLINNFCDNDRLNTDSKVDPLKFPLRSYTNRMNLFTPTNKGLKNSSKRINMNNLLYDNKIDLAKSLKNSNKHKSNSKNKERVMGDVNDILNDKNKLMTPSVKTFRDLSTNNKLNSIRQSTVEDNKTKLRKISSTLNQQIASNRNISSIGKTKTESGSKLRLNKNIINDSLNTNNQFSINSFSIANNKIYSRPLLQKKNESYKKLKDFINPINDKKIDFHNLIVRKNNKETKLNFDKNIIIKKESINDEINNKTLIVNQKDYIFNKEINSGNAKSSDYFLKKEPNNNSNFTDNLRINNKNNRENHGEDRKLKHDIVNNFFENKRSHRENIRNDNEKRYSSKNAYLTEEKNCNNKNQIDFEDNNVMHEKNKVVENNIKLKPVFDKKKSDKLILGPESDRSHTETNDSAISTSNNSIINSFYPKEEILSKLKSNPTQAISVSSLISNKSIPISISNLSLNFTGYESTKYSSKPSNYIKAYAANTYQGIIRNYNEDRVSIILNIAKIPGFEKARWPKCSFFGIYDGHGGSGCADFLRDKLHTYVIRDSNFPEDPIKALNNGFAKAERDFIEEYAMTKENLLLDKSGSCAVVALIVDDICFIANVGDSRAVLSSQGGKEVKVLTTDHKPNEEGENKRIVENGGRVYQTQTPAKIFNFNLQNNSQESIDNINQMLVGPYRVFPGRLSVSRTFGDVEAKEAVFGGVPNVVVAEPEIVCFKVDTETDFLVLGCDGIFDQLSNDDCTNSVWMAVNDNIKEANLNIHCAAGVDMIMKSSLVRRTLDNITCLLIAFDNMESIIKNNNLKMLEKISPKSSFYLSNVIENKEDITKDKKLDDLYCNTDPNIISYNELSKNNQRNSLIKDYKLLSENKISGKSIENHHDNLSNVMKFQNNLNNDQNFNNSYINNSQSNTNKNIKLNKIQNLNEKKNLNTVILSNPNRVPSKSREKSEKKSTNLLKNKLISNFESNLYNNTNYKDVPSLIRFESDNNTDNGSKKLKERKFFDVMPKSSKSNISLQVDNFGNNLDREKLSINNRYESNNIFEKGEALFTDNNYYENFEAERKNINEEIDGFNNSPKFKKIHDFLRGFNKQQKSNNNINLNKIIPNSSKGKSPGIRIGGGLISLK